MDHRDSDTGNEQSEEQRLEEEVLAAQAAEDMEQLWANEVQECRSFRRGDVVDGVVAKVDRDGVLVDIGSKSEGLIPGHELKDETAGLLKVGDEVLVYILQSEDHEGRVILSLDRARAERGWRSLQRYLDEGEIFEAPVVDHNKGGLIVNIEGVRGFVPSSQIASIRFSSSEQTLEEKLAQLRGQILKLKVVELNRKRNRLILSEKLAVQEWRSQMREKLMQELQAGETRTGRVASICNFGAFVDLGGIDGLVHLSELSWERVKHPKDVVKVGDDVTVVVLSVDQESQRVALSLRRAQPEPWSMAVDRYDVGQLVTGTITKLTPFGAFARVEEGIEGLIHISELDERRIGHPKEVIKEGEVLTLRVVRFEPERRRLGLSLKQALQEAPEEQPDTVRGEAHASGIVYVSESKEREEVPSAEYGERPPIAENLEETQLSSKNDQVAVQAGQQQLPSLPPSPNPMSSSEDTST